MLNQYLKEVSKASSNLNHTLSSKHWFQIFGSTQSEITVTLRADWWRLSSSAIQENLNGTAHLQNKRKTGTQGGEARAERSNSCGRYLRVFCLPRSTDLSWSMRQKLEMSSFELNIPQSISNSSYLKHKHLSSQDGQRVEATVADVRFSIRMQRFVSGRYSRGPSLSVGFAWIYGSVRAGGWDRG